MAGWLSYLTTNCGSQNWSSQLHFLKPIEPVWKQDLKALPVWATLLEIVSVANSWVIFLSVLFFNFQISWTLLENCRPLSGQSNYPRTESSPSLYHARSSLQGLWGRLLLPERLSQILLCVLCLTHQFTVLVPKDHLLHPSCSLTCLWAVTTGRRHFKTLFIKPALGDLLEKHAIYFIEKKQCFTPRILKTSHQPCLVKYRYYNPPSRKRSSFPGRPSIKSAGINSRDRRLIQVLTSMLKVTQFCFQTHHLNHNCFSLCF